MRDGWWDRMRAYAALLLDPKQFIDGPPEEQGAQTPEGQKKMLELFGFTFKEAGHAAD